MWFGTEHGLNCYYPESGKVEQYFQEEGKPNTLGSNNIRAITEDSEKTLWVATYGGGLSSFNATDSSFTKYEYNANQPQGLPSNLINTLYTDRSNRFWIGTENGGISVFDPVERKFLFHLLEHPDGKGRFTVNTIFQDDYGNFWIGTWERGLLKYEEKSQQLTWFGSNSPTKSKLASDNIRGIIPQKKDLLWLATYGDGLYTLDLQLEVFTQVYIGSLDQESDAQDFIWTAYASAQNQLWFGTFGKGLYQLNTLKNTFYHDILRSGPDNRKLNITSIEEAGNQKLWVGSLNNGLFKYDVESQVVEEFQLPAEPSHWVYSLCLDRQKQLWVGGSEVLYRISPDQKVVEYFTHEAGNKNSLVKSIINQVLEDSRGNIWLGFWEGGVQVLPIQAQEKGSDYWGQFQSPMVITKEKPIQGSVSCLFEDSKGGVWVGSAQDLRRYDPKTEALQYLNIRGTTAIIEDDYGSFWTSTNGQGLYKISKDLKQMKLYATEEGLNCLDIESLETDQLGRLWMSTSCGLSVFDPQTELISNFDQHYGLKKYSMAAHASCRLKDGRLIFGGNNGLYLFEAERVYKEQRPSPLYITNIKVDNQSIAYEQGGRGAIAQKQLLATLDTLTLPPKVNILTLSYAASNYTTPSDIIYGYRLEGVDEDWVIPEAGQRSATYSGLAPGTYTFEVKMSFHRGRWQDQTQKLTIILQPEYWDTLAFKLLVSLGAIAVLLGIGWLLLRRNHLVLVLEEKHRFIERLRKEKALLDIQNEELEGKIAEYHSKMEAMLLRYRALKEHLSLMHQQTIELLSTLPENNSKQLKQLGKTFGEQVQTFGEGLSMEDPVNLEQNDFFNRFAQAYPKLSANDLRIISLIRLNKSNKEIASSLNITVKSLEQSRYRIRKKMGLSSEINLNDLILRF